MKRLPNASPVGQIPQSSFFAKINSKALNIQSGKINEVKEFSLQISLFVILPKETMLMNKEIFQQTSVTQILSSI